MPRTRTTPSHKNLLDTLESRLLLSQTPLPITVAFANTTLASETAPGQTAPTFANGTDFRFASTTAPNALAQITRSFTITNTSNATLNLANVTLTGTNAADFSILSPLPGSLAPTSPATLTLAFTPSATGTRTATLARPDATNTDAPFLLDIQGTGIATTNLPDGLEFATVQAGTGNATAADGDILSMTYTGYLFSGSVFDATSLHNGTPFTFRLDNTPGHPYINTEQNSNDSSFDIQVIDGWEEGLQGIKQGESRVLIIPSALGYGPDGSPPSIPGDSPLVFETSLNELDYSPEVAVGGIDFNLIPSGTDDPNTTSGTDFGTVPAGQSFSQTFPTADFSNADDADGDSLDGLDYGNMTVTISGANASDFAVSAFNPITSGNNGNFSITFTPSGAGLRTATVHLHSNDVFNPDYTFTIQGTGTGSLSLALSANSLSIPNGESVPSANNFTDFRYQALSFSDPVTRTYTVTNTGTAVLALGNITIAGANPADFTISSPPALSSLNPSQSTTFTVEFTPTAAGTRAAIINLSSDSTAGTFSFAVSGIGVATATTAGNVRVATLQPGTGNVTAINGDLLQITFQGGPLTGTTFSGSAAFRLDNAPGHPYITNDTSPLSIRSVYDTIQIDGFENGLGAIKPGETRLLILPASQTIGATANGTLLPSEPLIYLVTCTGLISSPQIAVSSNNTIITPGSATPTATNGTDFGTLTGTQSSSSNFFTIFNNTFADDATGNISQNLVFGGISISGPNASEFGVITNPATPGVYQITFRPTGAGLRTATVHVASNDPQIPDYAFAIQGTDDASPDLQFTLSPTSFPTTTIATNTNTVLSLPIVITNIGANTGIANPTTDIQIFAHNTKTGANTLIAAYPALNISLDLNASAPYTLNAPIPLTLPTGTYSLLATINQSNAIADPNLTNNSATTTQTFSVNAIFTNLTANVLSSTFPKSLLAKTALTGALTFNIVNTGTLVLPKTQQASVTILARNNTTGATTTLTTLKPISLANLKPGANIRTTTPIIKLPAGLPASTYAILATSTPTPKLSESSTTDDTGASAFTLTVNPITYDLTGTLISSTLKSSPKGVSGNLNLSLRSLGNVNLAANQQVQLQIIAHPTTAPDATTDIILTTLTEKLANLAPQKPINFNLPINSTKILHHGTYQIEVRIVTTPHLAETNTTNNLLTQKLLTLISTNK